MTTTSRSIPVERGLYTILEAAAILGASRTTIYKLVSEGLLRAVKLGTTAKCGVRIPKADVDRLLLADAN